MHGCTVHVKLVKCYGYCLCTVHEQWPLVRRKTREKKKKKGENVETETQRSKRQPKHTLNVSLNASFHCPQIIDCPKYPTATVHFHTYSYPEGITSIFYLAELKVTIVLAELEFLDNNHFL